MLRLTIPAVLWLAVQAPAQFYDLHLRALQTSTTVYRAGGSVTVSYDLRNNGIVAAPATTAEFSIRYSLFDSRTVGSISIPSIPANQSLNAAVTIELPVDLQSGDPAGFGMNVDPDGLLSELNGGNNDREVRGMARSRTDLVVSSLQLSSSVWGPGDVVAINAAVRNRGWRVAGAAEIHFVMSSDAQISTDDLLLHSGVTAGIGALDEESFTASVTLPQRIPVGPCWIGAIVDPQGRIDESFENNNTGAVSGTCAIAGVIESIGSGCGPSQPLTQAVSGAPVIGSTLQFSVALPGRRGGNAVRLLALSTIPAVDLGAVGAPGCALYVEPLAVRSATVVLGSAQSALALPGVPELGGCEFYTQFAVLLPGANALGVLLSDAVRVRIGG